MESKKVDIIAGSVVSFVTPRTLQEEKLVGKTGLVVAILGGNLFDDGTRRLKVKTHNGWFWCNEDQVQLVTMETPKPEKSPKPSPKRTIVIEVTDNGAMAKYVHGKEVKKTASIKRHHDDRPDDEKAAILVTEKLFGRDLRDLENAVDEDFKLHSEMLGWIQGAMEALGEAEKRVKTLM